mgnify:CR=1 FL=1
MVSKKTLENGTFRNSADLCRLAETLGYSRPYGQLQCENGAFVSSLLDFFNDNPGAIQAVVEWAMENHPEVSEEEEEEDDPEACPGCGCKPGDGITESCNHPDGCGESKLQRGDSSKE